jgi:T-complex protein 1 subunit beta
MNIAMTTLSSKILSHDKEYFAELAVDAVTRLKVSKFLSNWCPQVLFIDHFVA